MSSNHIAFIYAGDLWLSDHDGGNVKRLTSDSGTEADPVFSPDGKTIAFSAQYDGNTDVYTVPVEGGIPQRLTWHPGTDRVRDFSPDGSSVLFISQREVHTRRYNQLFTVPVKGGQISKLKIPNAFSAKFSPDGGKVVYTPLSEPFLWWKNYRGGRNSTIWMFDRSDYSAVKIEQPADRANDANPLWVGNTIYFRSDRNGEFNIYSYDTGSKEITQLTEYRDFPVLNISYGSGKIVFEQAAGLHVFDPASGKSSDVSIGIAVDLPEVRTRYAKGMKYIRSASISPSGARAVFDFRGEIVTVPANKGDNRNITKSTGVHEQEPAWSPDGKSIAYFSDESGEYALHIAGQDGKGDVQKTKLNGAGFYSNIIWSPDSRHLTFADNSRTLYRVDLDKRKVSKIASDYAYTPGVMGSIHGKWSHDSKWILYHLNNAVNFRRAFVYSLAEDKSYPITDGLSEISESTFDKSGKYIYLLGSTDAGPANDWFAMSNSDITSYNSLYIVTLRKDIPSPFVKESDEEEVASDEEKDADEKTKPKETEEFSIDFDGLDQRIISMPVPTGIYSNIQSGKDGNLYYLERGYGPNSFFEGAKLHRYDLKNRKDEVMLGGIGGYFVSADNKKILYSTRSSWGIIGSEGKKKPGDGTIKAGDIEVKVDPRKEWVQIFDEAWRVNRDYMYVENMHGIDWKEMKKRYSAFLPHVPTRNDLNMLIRWMCSNVGVGHHRGGGGDFINPPKRVSGGLLGADYSLENGRYRIKKIYGGLNWNPGLRSPLTEPGVNVSTGDYIISVNGTDLRSDTNIYSLFEKTDGKIVELTVSSSPDGANSRITEVVPISNESSLRNRDWIEGNIKRVTEATDGRVAYVYVPNTAGAGHTYFKRYFFPQSNRDAVIVDERYNAGGSIADYVIDLLNTPWVSNWHYRYGAEQKFPAASIQGPKVMIIDETAGSGGDMLPWMFRKFEVGTLVGKRTWGGLVGVLGYPTLMDGGSVTAPNVGIWTEEGWVVENIGVPPDIEVEQMPIDVINGRDPQLEKAIEVALEELKKNPPKKYTLPKMPIRGKKLYKK
ncbi:MAG: peptidase S41 [bacterium]|nr:peptidase S41 [bacterium]